MIAAVGMSSASLADRNVSLPTFVNMLNYLLLACFYLFPRLGKKLHLPWWKYALFSMVDLEANTLIVLAFRFTSITSIQLLDAFSIPSVMVLSYIFLGSRYRSMHLVGVGMCLVGLILTMVSDLQWSTKPQGGGGSHLRALKGDVLALCGALLYACSNVAQENFVKNYKREEFLGMAGMWGTIFAGAQVLALEWDKLSSMVWTPSVVCFTCTYAICLFLLYSWTSLFLQVGDAALFNLSLLTADAYTLIFAYVVEHVSLHLTYFAAFLLIGAGLVVYHSEHPSAAGSGVDAADPVGGGGILGYTDPAGGGATYTALKSRPSSVELEGVDEVDCDVVVVVVDDKHLG
ncbi:unnamed protein product [Discosporangium mesarthrocarpum]